MRAVAAFALLLPLLFVLLLAYPASAPLTSGFYIQVSLTTLTVEAGESGTVFFSVNRIGGYNETVSLYAEDVPPALSVSVSPSSGTPGFNGTATISVEPWAEGAYSFTLKAEGPEGWVSSVTITVRVPYFTLSVEDPLLVVKNGSSASTTVRVISVYGYDEKVTLSLLDVPYYADVSLSRTSGTPSYTSVLSVSVDESAPFQSTVFKVRAVGEDGKAETESVELAVVHIGVEAELKAALDEHGRPRGNADGTFYPGDALNITFRAKTKNIAFSRFEFEFSESIFEGAPSLPEMSGWSIWEIEKPAPAGRRVFTVTAEAVYTSASGRSKTVTSSKKLTVEVVAYEPHFTVLASYLMLNMSGDAAFQKPFAVIVRYDGNGPNNNLDQRAVIDGLKWKGYAFTNMTVENRTVPPPGPGETVFYAEGLNFSMISSREPVIKVDGRIYRAIDLPLRFKWPVGSNHTYEWLSEVPCGTDHKAKFVYCELYGLNRTGTITQSASGKTVAGYYILTKDLEGFAEDTEEPVVWLDEVEVVVNSSGAPSWLQWKEVAGVINGSLLKVWVNRTQCPLVFDRNLRYAKLLVDVDGAVADRIQESIFRELDVYATFTCEAFSPKPIELFTANYSYVEQDYMQPFIARAYRLKDGEWMTDSARMRIIFSPVQNVTADLLTAHYEQACKDEIAKEMIRQDFIEIPVQIFEGRGEVSGEVINYIFLYNLTVVAVSPERSVARSFPIILFKTKREVYPIYVNLHGGGVNATVVHDEGQYATIRLTAPPEAGGIANVKITDEKGNILYEWNYSTVNIDIGVFGFYGETLIHVTKTPKTGTSWALTATNA